MSSSLSASMGASFAMVPLLGSVHPALVALKEARLHPRDLCLLWILLVHQDWRTGRIWLSPDDMAAAMGHRTPGVVAHSIRRLKAEGLVARGFDKRDPRRRFWCLNPLVCSSGGKHRQTMQALQFGEASERSVSQLARPARVAAAAEAARAEKATAAQQTREAKAAAAAAAQAARTAPAAASVQGFTAAILAAAALQGSGVDAAPAGADAAPVQAACPGPLSSPPAPALAAAAGDRPLVSVQAIADAVLAASRRQAERTPKGRLPEA